MKKALIINAHQRYEGFSEGKLNHTIAEAMKEELVSQGFEVKETILEKGYDAVEEVEKHIWADLIIVQAPIFWFNTPWIHKKYVDEVFTTGLVQQSLLIDDGRTRSDPERQYGTGGKMQGKKHMISLTWNAPKEAFGDKNQNLFEGKTVDDIFNTNTSVYKFCGVEILPSFSCFDVLKNPEIDSDIKRVKEHLVKVLN